MSFPRMSIVITDSSGVNETIPFDLVIAITASIALFTYWMICYPHHQISGAKHRYMVDLDDYVVESDSSDEDNHESKTLDNDEFHKQLVEGFLITDTKITDKELKYIEDNLSPKYRKLLLALHIQLPKYLRPLHALDILNTIIIELNRAFVENNDDMLDKLYIDLYNSNLSVFDNKLKASFQKIIEFFDSHVAKLPSQDDRNILIANWSSFVLSFNNVAYSSNTSLLSIAPVSNPIDNSEFRKQLVEAFKKTNINLLDEEIDYIENDLNPKYRKLLLALQIRFPQFCKPTQMLDILNGVIVELNQIFAESAKLEPISNDLLNLNLSEYDVALNTAFSNIKNFFESNVKKLQSEDDRNILFDTWFGFYGSFDGIASSSPISKALMHMTSKPNKSASEIRKDWADQRNSLDKLNRETLSTIFDDSDVDFILEKFDRKHRVLILAICDISVHLFDDDPDLPHFRRIRKAIEKLNSFSDRQVIDPKKMNSRNLIQTLREIKNKTTEIVISKLKGRQQELFIESFEVISDFCDESK